MLLDELICHFEQVKERKPHNENELLDYIQWCYIHNKLSIVEYRNLFYELTNRGASKPEFFINKQKLTPNA